MAKSKSTSDICSKCGKRIDKCVPPCLIAAALQTKTQSRRLHNEVRVIVMNGEGEKVSEFSPNFFPVFKSIKAADKAIEDWMNYTPRFLGRSKQERIAEIRGQIGRLSSELYELIAPKEEELIELKSDLEREPSIYTSYLADDGLFLAENVLDNREADAENELDSAAAPTEGLVEEMIKEGKI